MKKLIIVAARHDHAISWLHRTGLHPVEVGIVTANYEQTLRGLRGVIVVVLKEVAQETHYPRLMLFLQERGLKVVYERQPT